MTGDDTYDDRWWWWWVMDCYDDDDDGGAAMQIQQQATAIKMQQYASTMLDCEIMPKYYIGIGDNSDDDGDDR